jgi:hypothetical protein
MMKKFYFLLIFISCSNAAEDIIYPNQVILSEIFTLDFEDNPAFQTDREAYQWGYNDSTIYYTAPHEGTWNIYSLDLKKDIWTTTKFELEGPEGLIKFDNLLFLNDTLLLHPLSGHFSFQLIDLKNKDLHKYDINDGISNINLTSSKSVFYDGKIIGFPLGQYLKTDDIGYTSKAAIYGIYDLQAKELKPIIFFPEEFQGKVYSPNFIKHTFLVTGDIILINFAKSHTLYGYDKKGNLLFNKEVREPKVHISPIDRKQDPMKNMITTELGGQYSNLILDPSKNLFYRIARTYPRQYHNQVPNVNLFAEALPKMELSIMALDKNLDVIANGYFSSQPGEGIGDAIYFANQKGVYLWYFGNGQEDESKEHFIKLDIEARK